MQAGRHGAAARSRGVGPESFDDLGRVILLPPQSFDEPFGLGSKGLGLAARLSKVVSLSS